MAVTDTHEEKETLAVDVLLPGHEARVTTALFTHTKKQLIEREGGRCFICNATAEESGHPRHAVPALDRTAVRDRGLPIHTERGDPPC